MSFGLQVLVLAAGTYLFRISVVELAAGRDIPARYEAMLQLIPPAVLSALVASSLALENGSIRPFGPWWVAAAISTVVAAKTRSAAWTLAVGMVSVWILTALW